MSMTEAAAVRNPSALATVPARAFTFGSHQVRVVLDEDGNPQWVARDVCEALGIANSRDAISELDLDEKGVATTDTLGGPQEVATVTEPGLYHLILRSRKEEARAFRRWVLHEVLPAIRSTGRYESNPLANRNPVRLTSAVATPELALYLRDMATRALVLHQQEAIKHTPANSDYLRGLFFHFWYVELGDNSARDIELLELIDRRGLNFELFGDARPASYRNKLHRLLSELLWKQRCGLEHYPLDRYRLRFMPNRGNLWYLELRYHADTCGTPERELAAFGIRLGGDQALALPPIANSAG